LRLPYLRFAAVVARARREVLRDPAFADLAAVAVIPYSTDATVVDSSTGLTWMPRWAEFFLPSGPIVLYQAVWETMPDKGNYYRQIKDVLRHEYRHALDAGFEIVGHDDDPRGTIYARVRVA